MMESYYARQTTQEKMGRPYSDRNRLAGVGINGKRFQDLRKGRGHSQERMAELTGMSQSKISRIEKGEADNLDRVEQVTLAKILGTSIEYLYDEIDDPHPRGAGAAPTSAPRSSPADPRVARVERALIATMTDAGYELGDFDAARDAVRETGPALLLDVDPARFARQLIDAARQLRDAGLPLTTANVLARAASLCTQRLAGAATSSP